MKGLLEGTDYPALEVILIDNGTRDPSALELLSIYAQDNRVRIIKRDEPFNFARLCNTGVAAAEADLVLLYNNDVSPIAPGWLRELVAWSLMPRVGAVGPMLLYPDGRIQHAGVKLMSGLAGHPWNGLLVADAPVEAKQPHIVDAVTGACLLVSRDNYLAVDGMDEDAFPITLNDIDLCMKLSAIGLDIIYDGETKLHHAESVSRLSDASHSQISRRLEEMNIFRDRWRLQISKY